MPDSDIQTETEGAGPGNNPIDPDALLEEVKTRRNQNVWDNFSTYPREDWQYEVANGDTNLGYWDWVAHRIYAEHSSAGKKKPREEWPAYNSETEAFIETPAGEFLVFEIAGTNPAGTTYVRIIDNLGEDGKELVYWVDDEWREDPACVMGAILGAMIGGGEL